MTTMISSLDHAPFDDSPSLAGGTSSSDDPIARVAETFLCQRADDWGWERVDRFVYDNIEKALNADGSQRYSGTRVALMGSRAEIYGEFDGTDIELVMWGLKAWSRGIESHGGLAPAPEYIRMSVGRRRFVYDLATGTMFRASRRRS